LRQTTFASLEASFSLSKSASIWSSSKEMFCAVIMGKIIPKKILKTKEIIYIKHSIFHRENRVCKRFGVIPSNSIKKERRSKAEVSPHCHAKTPLSNRLYQMTNPSWSQKRTFIWSKVFIEKYEERPR
jgi:hypothetical protein